MEYQLDYTDRGKRKSLAKKLVVVPLYKPHTDWDLTEASVRSDILVV
jgi:hypothetical protein